MLVWNVRGFNGKNIKKELLSLILRKRIEIIGVLDLEFGDLTILRFQLHSSTNADACGRYP